MQFILKNKPDVHEWFYRKKVHDWFEGFEKELRDKLKDYGGGLILNDFIKEILGEA